MNYIDTDEQNDVLASLEMVQLALSHCEDNPNYWKWVVIALHSALQGALVCHLSDTAQLGALSNKSTTNWLDWYNRGRKGTMPKKRLAGPQELLDRLIDGKARAGRMDAGSVTVSPDQKRDFDLLHEFRNDFMHFQPTGWVIEISGMPRIVKSQTKIIADIFSKGWAFRHLDDGRKLALSTVLEKIRAAPIFDTLHD